MTVVTLGEILLRLSPTGRQRIIQADRFDATYGGAEANVAASLTQFGQDAYFVTKLPKNPVGDACLGHLRRLGVNTNYVRRGGDRLGIYFLEPGASQRPSQVTYDRLGSAVTTLTPDEVDWTAAFDGADWFHWSGITPALGEKPRQTLETALDAAQATGTTVSCDLNYRAKLWSPEEAQVVMCPLMEAVDLCIGNAGAARACLGVRWDDLNAPVADIGATRVTEERETANARLAEHLARSFGFETVALTLRESFSADRHGWSAILLGGIDGTIPLSSPKRSQRYEIEIVDRIGGGDSFAAGLIYGLLAKDRAADALEFAVAASCLKHTLPGDSNLSTVEEVEQLLDRSEPGRTER